MRHEGQEDRVAGNAGGVLPEGGLRNQGGRDSRPPNSTYRLKRSIEFFPAANGVTYLFQPGGEDVAIETPSAGARALLERLAQGYASKEELRRCCDQGQHVGDLDTYLTELSAHDLLESVPLASPLNALERQRYDRQLIYLSEFTGAGSADEAQRRLIEAKVLCLGCGGLGCWAASALVGAGIGSLVLVDDDRIELSNLNRQVLFAESDLGRLKVQAASEALKARNSELQVRGVELRVRGPADLRRLLGGVDLVIATGDDPPYLLPRWVNQACLETGVAYMSAGQLLPHVRLGPLVVPGETACLECQERRWRCDYPLYDELVAYRIKQPATAATLGAASGVIGSMLAMEAIHFLSQTSRPASWNKALMLDLRSMSWMEEVAERDPSCPTCAGLANRNAPGRRIAVNGESERSR